VKIDHNTHRRLLHY